jgi:hypothetical protein
MPVCDGPAHDLLKEREKFAGNSRADDVAILRSGALDYSKNAAAVEGEALCELPTEIHCEPQRRE